MFRLRKNSLSLSLSRLAFILIFSLVLVSCGGGGGGGGGDKDDDPGGGNDPISTDASLSDIVVSKGVLQPEFDPDTTTYLDAPVPFSDNATPAYNDTQSASITVKAADNGATIKINGDSVTPGSAYTINNLAVGPNTATIAVTAEDGETTETYTITLYRAIPVFKTGQTASSATGDDGDLQEGVSWPSPRFTDNGNGTITDNMTGLVWRNWVTTSTYTWENGLTYCAGLGDEWRMPNVCELLSLIHYGQANPATWLNGQGFAYAQNNSWCSTTYAAGTSTAWAAAFSNGYMYSSNNKTSGLYVWPVSGETVNLPVTGQSTAYRPDDDGAYKKGTAVPSIRFCDNGDGTITDNMTGLMWLKNDCGTRTWSNALSYIEGLNNGTNSGNCGYTDWRLPNVNEFVTLINFGQNVPYSWLNGQGLVNAKNGYYWTSTATASTSGCAWSVNFGGDVNCVSYGAYANIYRVWPVRGPVQ